jgi:hypothetical protein
MTHTRIFLFLALVTALGLGATMAEASEAPAPICEVTKTVSFHPVTGSIQVARKVVCIVRRAR